MDEEIDSFVRNQTWDLVKFPTEKRALQNKWVYRLKEEDGGKKWYKDRLVVKGFAQNKGIDFDEIFSLVVKMTSIRTILSLVAVEYLHLEQLDVKMAFLHGDWRKRFICSTHKGMRSKGRRIWLQVEEELVWPEASSKQWYLKFDKFMIEQGYDRFYSDHCVYFKRLDNRRYIILLLYVDDMLIVGSNMQDINVLKRKLAKLFAMKNLVLQRKSLV